MPHFGRKATRQKRQHPPSFHMLPKRARRLPGGTPAEADKGRRLGIRLV